MLLLFSDFIQDIDQSIGNIGGEAFKRKPRATGSKRKRIFKDSFCLHYKQNMTHEAVYMDMLKTVFNADVPGAQLHIR